MPPFVGRTIQVIWDTVNLCFYDPVSGELTLKAPYIKQNEQVLAQITYVIGLDTNRNYVPMPILGVTTYSVNINDNVNEQVSFAILEDSSAVNITGDWINSSTADPSQGQVSVRLDGTQPNVALKLNNKTFINTKLEIQGLSVSGNMIFVQRFPFFLYNNQDTN